MKRPAVFELTERVSRLRDEAVSRSHSGPQVMRSANQHHAFFDLFKKLPLRERQARSFAYALENEPVYVFPQEGIHGIFYWGSDPQLGGGANWGVYSAGSCAWERVKNEVPELVGVDGPVHGYELDESKPTFIVSDGIFPGHIAWNYDLILSQGVEGLIEKHRRAMEDTSDPQAREYYEGVIISLEGMLAWNRKHIEALSELLKSAESEAERKRIAECIQIMERVPAKPARNFHEALQSFYFQWLCVMYEAPYGGNSPGRMDYFLWPYLKEEYESGRLTYQRAGELLAEVFIKIDERVHIGDGHVNTIVVGGITPDGSDGVTPLTWLMLDVFDQLELTHPAVYTRISNVNPPEYVDRSVEYLLKGKNRGQILADEPIIEAMMRDGRMPFEDASMYMCGGCMEINPHGMNSDLLFSFIYNVPKTLELLVTGGQCLVTGKPRQKMEHSLLDSSSFEEFYAAFEEEVRRVLIGKCRALDIYCDEMDRCRPTFIQSSMIDDCLPRGRSQHGGGARYADYGGTPMGMQNAADALLGIKKAVFDERFCSAEELIAALKADFVGHEKLQSRLRAIAKYGQNDPEANEMSQRVLQSVCGILDSHTTRHGGKVKPVILTFVWAATMGENLGASADGRNSGQPIAHGLTPQGIGFDKGITAAINSYCSLDNTLVSGGASTMWDMDASWVNHDVLKSLVNAFMMQGGQIFQGNMTDVEDLRKAMDRPEDYPNLIVRVGGFSARFINLAKSVQQEIISRYRHCG